MIRAGVALAMVVVVALGAEAGILLRPKAGSTGVATAAPPSTARPLETTDQTAGTRPTVGSTPSTSPVPAPITPPSTLAEVVAPRVLVPIAVTASCPSSAPGTDFNGNPTSYNPVNVVDARPDTAWRCDGDATGQSITLTFAGPVHVSEIGLIPGFEKIDPGDGANRFVQGRKITAVTYVVGGRHIRAAFVETPTMQTTRLNLVTTKIHVILDSTVAGSSITDNLGNAYAPVDKTAISEIEVLGAPGAS